jgi:hypothetical protein
LIVLQSPEWRSASHGAADPSIRLVVPSKQIEGGEEKAVNSIIRQIKTNHFLYSSFLG